MKPVCISLFTALALFSMTNFCAAHFQMIYTPESALTKGGEIPLKVVFSHPFEGNPTMKMGQPEQFFSVHKEKKKDLLSTLKPIQWQGLENAEAAFSTKYRIRGMGDWIFTLVPAPYLETTEDVYIQQMTKMVVNAGGLPTDWDTELGLPAEIVPLDKPYAIWEGGVFRGIVKSEGKPVPFAEIEVEYLNHAADIEKNSFGKEETLIAPQDSFVTMGLKTDSQGEFVVALPKAGWWGICALGVGPEKEFDGKELSQDAVIWVQAKPLP